MLSLRVSARKLSFLPLSLCISLAMSGCSHILSHTSNSSAALRTSTSLAAPPTEEQKAIAHVRSLLLYQQATTACQQKRYRDAADLLARLAKQSDLTRTQITFI